MHLVPLPRKAFRPRESLALRLAHASGSVLVTFEASRAIVWLIGEIDLALTGDLARISGHLQTVASQAVIETSQMTSCDSTLAQFLSDLSGVVPTTVRRPSQEFRELIHLWDLGDRLRIRDVGDAL